MAANNNSEDLFEFESFVESGAYLPPVDNAADAAGAPDQVTGRQTKSGTVLIFIKEDAGDAPVTKVDARKSTWMRSEDNFVSFN